MLLRDPTQLPQRMFDALGERLKALAETERDRFDIGVGEHKVIDQMREGFSSNGNAQITHVRKIGLSSFTWRMDLLKDHLAFWPMQCPPLGDVPTQGHDLSRSIPAWMLLDEQSQQW